MGLSAPPPSWASIKNKPTTFAGLGLSDGVSSINGQSGAVTNTGLYAIGSYVTARPQNTTAYNVDSTIAGSSLYQVTPGARWDGSAWATGGGFIMSTAPTLVNVGTWRCVSIAQRSNDFSGIGFSGLWVRIS